ncbi:MAG: DUF5054 domain-containing protein [Anaerolineae bacterium]|nr:DUF5054 domain-containing protein [Anaerolineae bacterium]
MTGQIKTVHTIFKTHLDLGFTDLAANVVRQYFEEYLPLALHTAETLRRAGGPDRFIWTSGAWLIYHYLETASPAERQRMEAAIEAGDIAWHAMPFTVHSELLDVSLFRYGLRFAQQLDRRFGRRTIAAKMTDVPGHTRGIVPLLAEAGIQFLHIGVNEASTMPDVPPLFIWRDDDGGELVVMYQHTYGTTMALPDCSEAIAFGHTEDNRGPQSPEQVATIFAGLRRTFPQADVIASTLDAFARALPPIKDQLPVVTAEIGDSWIHGIASDPKKVSQFRALSRLRRRWLDSPAAAPDEQTLDRFSHALLLVAEHTWGMDVKTHLADTRNFDRKRFEVARSQYNFQKTAGSWREQRTYLDQAVAALAGSAFAAQARRHLSATEPAVPVLDALTEIEDASTRFETSRFILRFDPSSGALVHLVEKASARTWATRDCPLALVRYQTFSQADYDRFLNEYLAGRPPWAEPDFSKPGLASAAGQSRWWQPSLSRLFQCEDAETKRFLLELVFLEPCGEHYGCPARLFLTVDALRAQPTLRFDLQWFEKPANRQPEALWFSFCPQTPVPTAWTLDKLGKHISPLEVVRGGNAKLHAVGTGALYDDGNHRLTIETLDAPLIAPGEPSLLRFDSEPPALQQGMHVNLYNNIWGTNFPQWYDEDARFRFALHFSS